MSDQLHATIRHIVTVLAAVVFCTLALFAVLKHFAPPPGPVHAPVVVFSPSPVEHETQALVDALQAMAQSKGGVSVLEQPAVAVVRDTGVAKGLSDAQIAQILSALKAKTVEKVAVGSTLVGPSPKPTPSDAFFQQVYSADYSATTHALQDTKIKTDVTITREEIAPSRVGSIISSMGSGISYAVIRKHQYEFDLGLVEPTTGNHLAGTAAIVYDLPHTQLGIGPSITYAHGLRYGISAVVHF